MKTTSRLLGAASALALVVMSSAPALAQGTSAGSTITNNVSVSFRVGGVNQNAETASNTFTVDRKVNVTVSYVGSAVSVSPGQQGAVLAFDVNNLSNDTVDLALTSALASGTAANIGAFTMFRDTNNNGSYDAGDAQVTYLDEVGEDEIVRVFVVSNIGLNAANGDSFGVRLTANAHAGGGANALGSELVASTGANTAAIETVLADGAGAGDQANQGDFAAIGTYTVAGALITVAKSSRVISDPVNGTTNPKAVPGATVEYCITVANASGAALATNVSVTDDLPADVTYSNAFGIFINGDAACANGTAGGNFSAGSGPAGEDQVLANLADVAAGQTRSVYFRVEIN